MEQMYIHHLRKLPQNVSLIYKEWGGQECERSHCFSCFLSFLLCFEVLPMCLKVNIFANNNFLRDEVPVILFLLSLVQFTSLLF